MSEEGSFIACGPDWYICTGGKLHSNGIITFPKAIEPGTVTHLIAPSGFMLPIERVPVEGMDKEEG